MGVNKNIDELRKELENMHKIFDSVLFDKKGSSGKSTLAKDDKKTTKENAVVKNQTTKEKAINNSSTFSDEKKIENEEKTSNLVKNKEIFTEEVKEESTTQTESEIENKNETEEQIISETELEVKDQTEENNNLDDDFTFHFDETTKRIEQSDSKVINLHKKDQYLSIREKLEKIKNEIKQKELELKNKK